MKVSIVVPAHNAAATLSECLTACLNQTHPDCEVIVVDDGSTDTTADIAQSFPVTYINQAQQGPAAARNAGAKSATGEVLAFTDSDCVPHADWAEKLLAKLGSEFPAVGGTYGIANSKSRLASVVCAEITARHERYSESIDFAGSYNFAIFCNVFDGLNGFDESFAAASGEDNDLCCRLTDGGHGIAYAPDAVVDHYHPTRFWAYMRTQARHGFWRMKLYSKHPRRGRGDRYAGPFELLAPPLAIFLLAQPILWLVPRIRTIQVVTLIGAITLILFRLGCARQLSKRANRVHFLYCFVMFIFRDCARGLGMLRGMWHFLVLRRTTA